MWINKQLRQERKRINISVKTKGWNRRKEITDKGNQQEKYPNGQDQKILSFKPESWHFILNSIKETTLESGT